MIRSKPTGTARQCPATRLPLVHRRAAGQGSPQRWSRRQPRAAVQRRHSAARGPPPEGCAQTPPALQGEGVRHKGTAGLASRQLSRRPAGRPAGRQGRQAGRRGGGRAESYLSRPAGGDCWPAGCCGRGLLLLLGLAGAVAGVVRLAGPLGLVLAAQQNGHAVHLAHGGLGGLRCLRAWQQVLRRRLAGGEGPSGVRLKYGANDWHVPAAGGSACVAVGGPSV